jgi:hypothetical protein
VIYNGSLIDLREVIRQGASRYRPVCGRGSRLDRQTVEAK